MIHTHSSIVSEGLSCDEIPMSPGTKSIEKEKFKCGRLLGVGRHSQVYLWI